MRRSRPIIAPNLKVQQLASIRDSQYGHRPIALTQGSKRDPIPPVKFLVLTEMRYCEFNSSFLNWLWLFWILWFCFHWLALHCIWHSQFTNYVSFWQSWGSASSIQVFFTGCDCFEFGDFVFTGWRCAVFDTHNPRTLILSARVGGSGWLAVEHHLWSTG